jgi:hypothetical protein
MSSASAPSDERWTVSPFKEKLAYGDSKGLPFHVFSEQFAVYLRAAFPHHFRIWESGTPPPPFAVTEEMVRADLAAAGIPFTRESDLEQRKTYGSLITAKRQAVEAASLRIYGVLWSILSPEGRLAEQSLPNFKAFDDVSDPVGLRNAIFKIHQVAAGAAKKCASQIESATFDEYATCRMRPGQSLLEFKTYVLRIPGD